MYQAMIIHTTSQVFYGEDGLVDAKYKELTPYVIIHRFTYIDFVQMKAKVLEWKRRNPSYEFVNLSPVRVLVKEWISRQDDGSFVLKDQLGSGNQVMISKNQRADDTHPFVVIGSEKDGSDYVFFDVAGVLLALNELFGRDYITNIVQQVVPYDKIAGFDQEVQS